MIQGKILTSGDNLEEAFEIRKKVFIEELGIPKEIQFDQLDMEAMHVLVYEEPSKANDLKIDKINIEKKAVATGRIVYDGEECQISNVAVLTEYRNRKYGDFTVRMLLNKAFTAGVTNVTVNASQEVTKFFEKIGFRLIENEFKSTGSLSYNMIIHVKDIVTKCKK